MGRATPEYGSAERGLEAGLLRVMRIVTTASVVFIPLSRRFIIRAAVGVDLPLMPFVLVAIPVPVLLMALTWIPSWEGRRGRALLLLFVTMVSLNLLADKFVTIAWLLAPEPRERAGLLLLVRLWPLFHFVTLLVAWQYSWRPATLTAVTLCAVDFVLSLPFVSAGGPLYRLFLIMSAARLVSVASIATLVGWVLQQQRAQKAALAAANEKLAAYAATSEQLAISRERNRLARELHDTLAHSLSVVAVQLEAVQALWESDAQRARTMLGSALQNARSGLTEARRALKALRASPLDDEGLAVALGNLARSTALRANLRLELDIPADASTVRPEREQFLYRVAQEALSNVVRHASATEVRVALKQVNGQVTLTVADNGQGFDAAGVDASTHFGLKGIQERADMMSGQLTIDSERGRGTVVRVAIAVEDAT